MIEKFGRLAAAMATKVSLSRRGFLGRVGEGALGVVGAVAVLLALPSTAHCAACGDQDCDDGDTCCKGGGGKSHCCKTLELFYCPPSEDKKRLGKCCMNEDEALGYCGKDYWECN